MLAPTVVFGKQLLTGARHGFGITADGRRALQEAEQPQYRIGREFAAFVRAQDPAHRSVYVLGNPLDQYLSGTDQPIPTNGWAAEQYNATAWDRIATQLSAAKPSILVVDDFSAHYMELRSPATARLVAGSYCLVRRVEQENWYVLRTSTCAPAPVAARTGPAPS
jgi:hypothetical protein